MVIGDACYGALANDGGIERHAHDESKTLLSPVHAWAQDFGQVGEGECTGLALSRARLQYTKFAIAAFMTAKMQESPDSADDCLARPTGGQGLPCIGEAALTFHSKG